MKILIIDDEKSILNLIRLNLELEGYTVFTSETGLEGITQCKELQPDLVVLDVMLPDITGYQVLRKLREYDEHLPVIMLTAKGELNDRLLGLQLGADDYLSKPFNNEELVLRIKAVIKRSQAGNTEPDDEKVIRVDNLVIYTEEHLVTINGEKIELTHKEFDTLLLMVEHKNKVFSREKLLQRVWDYAYQGNTRSVDMLIQRLRKKLGPYASQLKTIYGIGYKFEV